MPKSPSGCAAARLQAHAARRAQREREVCGHACHSREMESEKEPEGRAWEDVQHRRISTLRPYALVRPHARRSAVGACSRRRDEMLCREMTRDCRCSGTFRGRARRRVCGTVSPRYLRHAVSPEILCRTPIVVCHNAASPATALPESGCEILCRTPIVVRHNATSPQLHCRRVAANPKCTTPSVTSAVSVHRPKQQGQISASIANTLRLTNLTSRAG